MWKIHTHTQESLQLCHCFSGVYVESLVCRHKEEEDGTYAFEKDYRSRRVPRVGLGSREYVFTVQDTPSLATHVQIRRQSSRGPTRFLPGLRGPDLRGTHLFSGEGRKVKCLPL